MGLALLPLALVAQDQQGWIEYEDVIDLQLDIPEDMKQYAVDLPTEMKTNMVLLFDGTQSMYQLSDKGAEPEIEKEVEQNGVDIDVQQVVIGGGASRSTYIDHKAGVHLRADDLMGKKFLVTMDAAKLQWKVLDKQRQILGYTCIMASTKNADGQNVTAWFTPQIPLPIGPDGYSGLAGAVLALVVEREDGNITIAATEVVLKPLKKKIEKPKKGQKVNEKEFDAIVEKRMQAMQEMHGGDGDGNVIIRVEEDMD